jgi:response regulator RpfG family c-di-GMP phosphodiesterase
MIDRPKHVEAVLIVADDPELLTSLSWELGGEYPVLPCESFSKALTVARCAKPDAIVLHFTPTQKKQIASILNDFKNDPIVSNIPVLLISGLKSFLSAPSRHIGRNRVAGHLRKPIAPETLRTEVRRVLTSNYHGVVQGESRSYAF